MEKTQQQDPEADSDAVSPEKRKVENPFLKTQYTEAEKHKMHSQASMSPHINPDLNKQKREIITNLYSGGSLNTLVKRKIRLGVTKILSKDVRDERGHQYAQDMWNFMAGKVIACSISLRYPKTHALLPGGIVDKIKITYEFQVSLVDHVLDLIDSGRTEYQIMKELDPTYVG